MDSIQLDNSAALHIKNRIVSRMPSGADLHLLVRSDPGRNIKSNHRASGCLSEISIPLVLDEEYFAALKDFADTYSDYQAYLFQSVPRADECVADVGVDDYGLHEPVGADPKCAGVSDDEIEGCGYLGWLRH